MEFSRDLAIVAFRSVWASLRVVAVQVVYVESQRVWSLARDGRSIVISNPYPGIWNRLAQCGHSEFLRFYMAHNS